MLTLELTPEQVRILKAICEVAIADVDDVERLADALDLPFLQATTDVAAIHYQLYGD